MSMKLTKSALAVALAGSPLAEVAAAYEAGNWISRVGAWSIFPKSGNLNTTLGTIGVDNGYSPGLNLTYMATPSIGIELIAALPFKHDVTLSSTKIASTYQLPPTIFVQYHFMPSSNMRPYAGVGLNYTFFWDEKTTGPLSGTSLNLGSSWGTAGELGVDIDIAPKWFINAVVSYMDINTKAKSNVLGNLGTVNIDPVVVGINIGTRF